MANKDISIEYLNNISNKLKLEKILVSQKVILYFFKKDIDNNFIEEVDNIRKEIGNLAEIKIVEDAEKAQEFLECENGNKS